jgi:hypothetical protein
VQPDRLLLLGQLQRLASSGARFMDAGDRRLRAGRLAFFEAISDDIGH